MADSLPVLRMAGVPEHFNWPFQLAIKRGLFHKAGVDVRWTDIKAGTGALINAAKSNEQDVIVALTEGLVADIVQGSELRLVSSYVESPLVWAISTGGRASAVNGVEDLKGQTIAVSRLTSGSHLMTCVLASQRGWKQDDVQYAVKGPFEALRAAVNDGSAAAFMWEQFMTKPYYDSGELRRIGTIITPWPCFLLAATQSTIDAQLPAIRAMLSALREACRLFHTEPNTPADIAAHFHFQPADAVAWYHSVHISAADSIALSAIQKTIAALREAHVLPEADGSAEEVDGSKLVDARLLKVERDIGMMRLYNKPELVQALHNSLREAKLATGPVSYQALNKFDFNSYMQPDSIDTLAHITALTAGQHVLNLGSSVGGPARYLAGKYGVNVLAVEWQHELHSTASELSLRCESSMSGAVTHVGADMLTLLPSLADGKFDVAYSALTLLHVQQSQRAPLFRHAHRTLQPRGYFYTEDWYARGELSAIERSSLCEQVYCQYLPTQEQYVADVNASGLLVERCEELTEQWVEWVRARRDRWVEGKERLVGLHGEELYGRLLRFYEVIVRLMEGGNVGGVRIVARKE